MTTSSIPAQYIFLLRFLRECSESYAKKIEKLASDCGDDFNPRTARFEVDAYFAYLLSASMKGLKHNPQVWEEMCHLCEDAITGIHHEKVSSEDLSGVFIARFDDYADIANRYTDSDDTHKAWTRALRQHIMASSHTDRVEAKHPLMGGGFIRESTLREEYNVVDFCTAGGFACGLKHIMQRTNDVRTLTEEELTTLGSAGLEEVSTIMDEIDESMALQPAPKSRPWWRFWS